MLRERESRCPVIPIVRLSQIESFFVHNRIPSSLATSMIEGSRVVWTQDIAI